MAVDLIGEGELELGAVALDIVITDSELEACSAGMTQRPHAAMTGEGSIRKRFVQSVSLLLHDNLEDGLGCEFGGGIAEHLFGRVIGHGNAIGIRIYHPHWGF